MAKNKRRRGSGEGTIVKRRDGRYAAAVTLRNGKRKWLYAKSRREVATKLTVVLKSVQDGALIPLERENLSQFATRWLEWVEPNLKPSTHLRYASDIRLHIVPELGRMPLKNITPDVLQHLYTLKLNQGLSSTSVHHVHVVIHRLLSQAVKWELVSRNSAALVDSPRPQKTDMQTLDATQVRQLIRSTSDHRLGALVMLAAVTGIRQGELLGLRWSDMELSQGLKEDDSKRKNLHSERDDGVIHIRRTLRACRGGFEFGEPKTSRSKRTIVIRPYVVSRLRTHRAKQMEEMLAIGPSWNHSDLIFTNTIGGHLTPQNFLRRDFKPMLEYAGLPDVNFHSLRHTAATLALNQGVSVVDVSAMLGHANSHITLTTYAHLMPGSGDRTAAAMESAIFG